MANTFPISVSTWADTSRAVKTPGSQPHVSQTRGVADDRPGTQAHHSAGTAIISLRKKSGLPTITARPATPPTVTDRKSFRSSKARPFPFAPCTIAALSACRCFALGRRRDAGVSLRRNHRKAGHPLSQQHVLHFRIHGSILPFTAKAENSANHFGDHPSFLRANDADRNAAGI